MGAVGAIVLAVLPHHKKFSRRGKIAAWIALATLTLLAIPAFLVWQDEWLPAPLVSAGTAFLGFGAITAVRGVLRRAHADPARSGFYPGAARPGA